MSLTVSVQERGVGIFTVSPAGSLDSSTYAILESRLELLKQGNPRAIILDLKDLTYISSAGLRVILVLSKAMKERGGTLTLIHLQPQIRKVFDIIQAVPSWNVFESVEELDHYLTEMQRKVIQENQS